MLAVICEGREIPAGSFGPRSFLPVLTFLYATSRIEERGASVRTRILNGVSARVHKKIKINVGCLRTAETPANELVQLQVFTIRKETSVV